MFDRGVKMIFIGYANSHDGDCFRMYNPATNGVSETRDVIWLRRMYYEQKDTDITKQDPIVILEEAQNPEERESPSEIDNGIKKETTSSNKQVRFSEDSEARESDDESAPEMVTRTRSGRITSPATMYEPSSGKTVYVNSGNEVATGCAAFQNYYTCLQEIEASEMKENLEVQNTYMEYQNVGAGVGGGFENTAELRPMKYGEAINGPDGEAWKREIQNEHERMVKNKVFKAISRSEMPEGTKTIDSTWACKKKSPGKLRGRLNARGFKQIEGKHFDGSSIHAPVTNAFTIRILLVLMILSGGCAKVVDVMGAFLHGHFQDGEEIFMEVPEGWENYYPKNVVLMLLKTLYGLRQSAMAFWREL